MKGFTMKTAFVSLVLAFAVIGCASSSGNLQRETARFIGDMAPEDVTISDIDRGVSSAKWEASTPMGDYHCSADDMIRRVHCVKN